MIYSKTCEYALRALSYLATKIDRGLTMITEIGDETNLPMSYIAKIFQSLVRNDILISRRGPAGGFGLKKNPENLTLLEIVKAVDDIEAMKECVMGLEKCSTQDACPLHETWTETKEKILQQLEQCSLSDFIKKTGDRTYRPCRRARLSLSF